MNNPHVDAVNNSDISNDQKTIVLGVVLNVFDKWECSEKEKMALLGVSRSTLHKYQNSPESARVDQNLLERISYILNMHQSLRVMFENPENVYGFVRKSNHNDLFNGATPMDYMSSGLVADIYKVYNHLDALRGGHW
jgi:hypothetical protein